jgi:deazaflavin-dependent oxidoreductase (nitroreductase family)
MEYSTARAGLLLTDPQSKEDPMASEQSTDREARPPATAGRRGMSIFERYLRPLIGKVNPRIMGLAGTRWSPTVSVLTHRGHRSGRLYTTPVSALPRGGFFWIGLAFGEEAGWTRNVLAAGECGLRYRGADYRLVEPVVVQRTAVTSQLPVMLRMAGPVVGIHKILRMRAIRAAA